MPEHRVASPWYILIVACFLLVAQPALGDSPREQISPPNIIVILTDDMGYSDLGCYGGEIETPNIDSLANNGLRFTQFYNNGVCCSTRSSLVSGLYPHQAGMGQMTKDRGPDNPGYRGRLMARCVTIGEVLGTAGYHTFHTGKWQMGSKEKDWWPIGRGFERSYGCPQGGGFYFRPSAFPKKRAVTLDDTVIYDHKTDPPETWFSTDAWTDEGLKFVQDAVEMKKPFLWYLAYNAPHWPLKAKAKDIEKYRGKYRTGWDELRRQRYHRQIELGIIDKHLKLSPRDSQVPTWDSLSTEEKEIQDLRMATYAAAIDCVDQNIGKLIAELKRLDVHNNTLILFLHDNGGEQSGGVLGSNTGTGECGQVDSHVKYGACWANVSNTPFRKYKTDTFEGGISTPLVVHWPDGIAENLRGTLNDQTVHLTDFMPTFIELSQATYPDEFKGNAIIPMEGKSLLPILKGRNWQRQEPLCFAFNGAQAIRHNQWKLVRSNAKDPWELYDMETDRTELNDLADEKPNKLSKMSVLFDAWATRCFVE